MLKTREECAVWCNSFLNGKFGVRPNVEDCNFLRSIVDLLSEVEPKKNDDPNEAEWSCGACEYPLWDDEYYCAHCGKKVNWDGKREASKAARLS